MQQKIVTAVPGCTSLRLLNCRALLSRIKMGFLSDMFCLIFFLFILYKKNQKQFEACISFSSVETRPLRLN